MAFVLPPVVFAGGPSRSWLAAGYFDAGWERAVPPPPVAGDVIFDRQMAALEGYGTGGGVTIIIGGGKPPDEGQLWPRGDGSAP